MKILAIVIFSLISLAVCAQENEPEFDGHKWEAPYTLPVPKDWTIERFLIPISFAPQISYKGVEDIRFAPGWGKVKSEAYWTYAFLWYLEGDVKMDAGIIAGNLKAYYTGLVAVNGPKIPAGKMIPVTTSFRKTGKDKGDLETYAGTIKMLDYMAKKPMILNCRVHVKTCPGENKTFIFYQLSPQPPVHRIWKSLNQLWLHFSCVKG